MKTTGILTLDGFRGQHAEIPLTTRTLIAGDNASGKTSVTEAILFLLHGCVPTQGKGRDALAKLIGPEGAGTVTLRTDDGWTYSRTVAVKKKAATVETLAKRPDGTFLDGKQAEALIEGEVAPAALTQISVIGLLGTPDRKRLILDLLPPDTDGMTWVKEGIYDALLAGDAEKSGDLFRKVKVSGSQKRADELAAKAGDRLPKTVWNVLANATDPKEAVEQIRNMKNAADQDRKAAETMLAKAAEATVSEEDAALVGELDSIQAELQERQADLANLTAAKRAFDDASRKRTEDQAMLATLQQEHQDLDAVRESVKSLTEARDQAKQALDAHKKDEPVDASDVASKLALDRTMAQASMDAAKERGKIAFDRKAMLESGSCPCCGRAIAAGVAKAEIAKCDAQLVSARGDHAAAKELKEAAEQELRRYEADKAKAQASKEDWTRKKFMFGTAYDKAVEALSVASAKIDPLRVQRMEAEIARTQSRLKAIVEGVDEHRLTALQAAVDRLADQQRRAMAAKAITDIAGAAKVSEKRAIAETLKTILEGADKAMKAHATQRIQALVEPMEKSLKAMALDGSVALDLGDEFRLGLNRTGKYVDLDVLSGSEYVRFVLAMLLALRGNGGISGWIVIDSDGLKPGLLRVVMEHLASIEASVVMSSWVEPEVPVDGWATVVR